MTTDQANISGKNGGNGAEDAPLSGGEQPVVLGMGDAANDELGRLREELAQAKGDYQRVLADFANYQRRALQNEQTAKVDGAGRVASDVVNVIDHFDLALAADLSKATTESLVSGMKMVREELIKSLARHGVALIVPRTNDEFTPGRHEAIMQQSADGVEPGRVVSVLQPGYMLVTQGVERVIRAAKVSVAPSA